MAEMTGKALSRVLPQTDRPSKPEEARGHSLQWQGLADLLEEQEKRARDVHIFRSSSSIPSLDCCNGIWNPTSTASSSGARKSREIWVPGPSSRN